MEGFSVGLGANPTRQSLEPWKCRGYRMRVAAVRALAASEPDFHGLRLYVEYENHGARQTHCSLGMPETRYRLYEETVRQQPRNLR